MFHVKHSLEAAPLGLLQAVQLALIDVSRETSSGQAGRAAKAKEAERTESGHGAINAFVGANAFFSLTGGNPFAGPAPTGAIGGSAFIVVAALMLWDMHRREKAGTLSIPQAGLPDNPYLTRSAQ